tara:strand:- start:163 stop:495 length:333 start_codon:yes stop_codon:yes gene_type:complete
MDGGRHRWCREQGAGSRVRGAARAQRSYLAQGLVEPHAVELGDELHTARWREAISTRRDVQIDEEEDAACVYSTYVYVQYMCLLLVFIGICRLTRKRTSQASMMDVCGVG